MTDRERDIIIEDRNYTIPSHMECVIMIFIVVAQHNIVYIHVCYNIISVDILKLMVECI